MKTQKGKRALLALVLLLPLALGGCYASTPTISGNGDLFPEYPTPTGTALAAGTAAIITAVPSSTPYGGIIVISGTSTAAPAVAINTLEPTIMAATPVPATPTPVPTVSPTPVSSSLKKGSQGDAVRDLQKRLKNLGFYSGNVDGDFGAGTEEAVKRFQRQYGLTDDGIAGTRTLRALDSAAMTAAPTFTPTPKPTAAPNYNDSTYLRNGETGTLVRKVQDRLIELGYLAGEANGKYNNATEAAVRAFQKRANSTSDGIAGKETLDKLFARNARITTTPSGVVGVTLHAGDEQPDAIKALQTRLKALGYYNGVINGNFGTNTENAVTLFQSLNGIKADGVAGTATLEKIFAQDALTYKQARNNAN